MTVLSFISMYVLMYSNLNQFYMAGLMTAPMVIIELAVMGSLYQHRNANIVNVADIVTVAVAVVALGVFFLGIKQQVAIDDKAKPS
jgi:hypothetical protein